MTNTNTQLQLQLISGPISPAEKEIILANLNLTNGVIAEMLSRSEGSIRNFLSKNGIKRTSDQVASTKLFAGSKRKGEANGNWKEGRSKSPYFYKKKHAHKHLKKARARNIVYKAKRAGLIIQKFVCVECGTVGETELHHDDYSKPLEVRELCKSCHIIADVERQLKEAEEDTNSQYLMDDILRISQEIRPGTSNEQSL